MKKKIQLFSLLIAVIMMLSVMTSTVWAFDEIELDDLIIDPSICGDGCAEFIHFEEENNQLEGINTPIICYLEGHDWVYQSTKLVYSYGPTKYYCYSERYDKEWKCSRYSTSGPCGVTKTTTDLYVGQHNWSVGWAGQTCNKCGYVDIF